MQDMHFATCQTGCMFMSSVAVNDHKSAMNVFKDVFIFTFSTFMENSTTRHAAAQFARAPHFQRN
jgi:hypothetical protein